MSEHSVNLAALIGSRICHDLISPIGAITNGLELLDMSGAPRNPEMDLIADSVDNAGLRIRFFRIAYGMAGDQMLGREEVAGLLADLGREARVKADWRSEGAVPRSEVRLALLALQCCETALPLGGRVEIDRRDGRWFVAATGPKLALHPELWDGLSDPARQADVTPAQVQFALLPALAAEQDRRVHVTADEAGVGVAF
ncbi:histidine phosphotransferase ChpT [Cribrihabitans marinus]|uniref:Histidine phosphotransferase ChpT n=1 Tax=Cribrihabitans marinus TaxID=1227549 RepID=A0A1H6QIR1_9RHOB|nr:histidine phosphotransferase family protein [Cribrihabitans marinus]GGH18063.1 histidine phosphotransferase [Cribrihabitans marinus]SEI39350.1 histidine phosphotransferase ChpT [Cribrihabitans marinus]